MSDADRNALGATLKDRGNKLYAKKDFKKAVECYSKAIEVSVKKDAVFYSNRAACECLRWAGRALHQRVSVLMLICQVTLTTLLPSTTSVLRTATRLLSLTAPSGC